ncbi:hypothetical protein [Pseudarthrobacter sp. MDT1-22]
MKLISPAVGLNALFGTLAAFAILGVSALSTHLTLQITLLGILLVLSFTVGSIPRILILAASVVPILAFIRRISAGPEARVDFDPLILFPFILVLIVTLGGFRRSDEALPENRQVINRRIMALAVVFIIAVGFSILLSGSIKPDVIYFATALVIPILLVAVIATGGVVDIWDSYERLLPVLGLLVGAYGIVQFVVLPPWDKSWMLSSELQSIGQAAPLAVRVFGMSESPGPYAAFIGVAIIICVDRALKANALLQVGWFVVAGMLVFPLLLSGVRSALLSLLVCAATATVIRGRGMGRVVPVIFFVLVGVGIDRLVGAFGSDSTILTADRYTAFDPSQDHSVQARLNIFDYLTNPWPHIIGHPDAAPVDNLPIDILRAYGFLPFIILILLLFVVSVSSFRLMKSNDSSSVGLSALYVLILGISGNLFLSSFGILIGIVFGTVLKRALDAHDEGLLGERILSRKIELNQLN